MLAVPPVTHLDPDRCYQAVSSRDVRFDGQFVTAVRTTGIFCRPSCPAITPRRANVVFLPSAAAAVMRGYRACRRRRTAHGAGTPGTDPTGGPERHDTRHSTPRCLVTGT